MIPGISGQQVANNHQVSLYDTLVRDMAAGSGLQLLVDAGDSASFPGTGQVITDRSGAGSDLRIGSTTGVDADDMLWTGVAGRNSNAEYFYPGPSFGYAPLPSAVGAWAENLHKDGAIFAIAGWQYYVPTPALGGGLLIENMNGSFSNIGISLGMGANASGFADKLGFSVANGSGTPALQINSALSVPANAWSFYAVIINEPAGTWALIINDTVLTGSASYSSPTATDSTANFAVQSSAGNPSQRFANLAVWQNTIPTTAKLVELYQRTRGKFGV